MASNPKAPAVHGIFRRLSIVKSSRGLGLLINEYVDQASKFDAIDPAKADAAIGDDAVYRALKDKKKLPQRPGKDFIASQHPTPVYIGGFLSKFAPAYNLAKPEDLAPGLAQIGKHWEHLTAGYAKRAHHLLFSINEDLQARCLRFGIPVQDVLMAGAIGAMNRFGSWAHPTSNLGYILGTHTDKPNTHLHGLVFPKDSAGNQLNLSRFSDGSKNGMRVDYQGYLHNAYEEYLADFATITGPDVNRDQEYWKQAAVRGALVSMRDFNQAIDAVDAGKHTDKVAAVLSVSRANAEDYQSPDALRTEQSARRKFFVEELAPMKGQKKELAESMGAFASKVRVSADVFGAQAEAIRLVREGLEQAHQAHFASPFAYRLATLPNGSLPYPVTITQEWAEKLPEHGPLLLSTNPFLWDEGAKRVAESRMAESKTYSKVARDACASVAATLTPAAELPTRLGYYLGGYAELNSVVKGTNPHHLDTRISEAPTPGIIADPDKGFAALKHAVLERGNTLLMKHQPFDPVTDNGKDFSPVWRRADENEDESPEGPAVLPNKDALLYKPIGINPDQTYEPTELEKALDLALEGYRRPQIKGPSQGAGPTPDVI